jgi:hypothetical protein
VLHGNARKSQVTAASLATYLAESMERRRIAAFEGAAAKSSRAATDTAARSAATATQNRAGRNQLAKAYRFALKDYFAAVFRQRNTAELPLRLRAAVLAGQVILILLPLVALGWNVRSAFLGDPAELTVVKSWIQAEHGDYAILDWNGPEVRPEDSAVTMQVRYEFHVGSKRAVADRNFVIKSGEVVAW